MIQVPVLDTSVSAGSIVSPNICTFSTNDFTAIVRKDMEAWLSARLEAFKMNSIVGYREAEKIYHNWRFNGWFWGDDAYCRAVFRAIYASRLFSERCMALALVSQRLCFGSSSIDDPIGKLVSLKDKVTILSCGAGPGACLLGVVHSILSALTSLDQLRHRTFQINMVGCDKYLWTEFLKMCAIVKNRLAASSLKDVVRVKEVLHHGADYLPVRAVSKSAYHDMRIMLEEEAPDILILSQVSVDHATNPRNADLWVRELRAGLKEAGHPLVIEYDRFNPGVRGPMGTNAGKQLFDNLGYSSVQHSGPITKEKPREYACAWIPHHLQATPSGRSSAQSDLDSLIAAFHL